MPMRSQAQRRFWWATDPETARKWEDETPKGKKLPERVSSKKGKKSSLAAWAKS
jgi:hypothetical protein